MHAVSPHEYTKPGKTAEIIILKGVYIYIVGYATTLYVYTCSCTLVNPHKYVQCTQCEMEGFIVCIE